MKVNLEDVIEAIAFADGEVEYYYCVKTGLVHMCLFGMIDGDDNPELAADMEENEDDYIRLPGQYEINEYNMMEEFINSIPSGRTQSALDGAIRGRGAFRRFKDMVAEMGLEKKWFDYRDGEHVRIAKEWCERNGIKYES